MPNTYDFISPFYSNLKALIFGNTLQKLQTHFLNAHFQNSTCLVIGSGNLDFLPHIKVENLYLDCLDISSGMSLKAKENLAKSGLENVKIINADFKSYQNPKLYDVICLPFILDCLNDTDIQLFINKTYNFLNPGGSLIISDFRSPPKTDLKNRLILKCMYIFFKVFTNIDRYTIPDYDLYLGNKRWSEQKEISKWNSFIFSKLLKKL